MASPDHPFGLGRLHVVDARKRGGDHSDSQTTATTYLCDLIQPILLHTEQLFFLLEAVERMADQPAETQDWQVPHAPPGMSLALMSRMVDETYNLRSEIGSDGRLVQLAYRGWVAMVAGTWERFRKLSPYRGKASGLPMGMQTGVFGDLQKIRNDVLKNGAVAANGAERKCEVLKWFAVGEPIVFKLDHVIEFLHLNAMLPTESYVFSDNDGKARVVLAWHPKENQTPPPWRNPPFRVVSASPFIDRIGDADPEPEHGLFMRMAFADGLTWTVLVERSANSNRLSEKKRAIEAAPAGGLFGLPHHPDLRWDVPVMYARAKASLSQGSDYRPPRSVGPEIQMTAAEPSSDPHPS